MIDKDAVWQQVYNLLNPITESHEHPDKKYGFEIKFNGHTKAGYMYAYDGVDENYVYNTEEENNGI